MAVIPRDLRQCSNRFGTMKHREIFYNCDSSGVIIMRRVDETYHAGFPITASSLAPNTPSRLVSNRYLMLTNTLQE